MQLIKRRKIKPKFNRFSIFQSMPKDGKDGKDGITGNTGQTGQDGNDGFSVVDAFQVDDKSFKLKFSNGQYSQKIDLPLPKSRPGVDGQDGKDGNPGNPGQPGANAPTIVDIQAFSRRIIFRFSDGSEIAVPLRFPSGTTDNPALGFGGSEPTVRDIIGVGAISVEDRHGIFFISVENDDTIGLPYYFVKSDLVVTIPKFRQHLTVGDLTIEGEMIVEGELQVI